MIVELFVHRTDKDCEVRMIAGQFLHAGRRGADAEQCNVPDAPAFQARHRRTRAPAGRQHRVQDESNLDRRQRVEFAVVLHRRQRLLISEHAQMIDFGGRQQIQNPVHHPQPGAEDGHQPDRRGHAHASRCCQRGLHLHGFGRQILGRRAEQQPAQRPEVVADRGPAGLGVANLRQEILRQRMIDDSDGLHPDLPIAPRRPLAGPHCGCRRSQNSCGSGR